MSRLSTPFLFDGGEFNSLRNDLLELLQLEQRGGREGHERQRLRVDNIDV